MRIDNATEKFKRKYIFNEIIILKDKLSMCDLWKKVDVWKRLHCTCIVTISPSRKT